MDKQTELNEEIVKDPMDDVKKYKTLTKVFGVIAVLLGVVAIYMSVGGAGVANGRVVEKNDKILVDMMVTENGRKNDDRSFTDVLVSVNQDSFSEEIIKALDGMDIGETKSVTIKETLLKDNVKIEDIPDSAYQDGSASKYYEEKDVKYTFKVKTIWKYASDITEKTEDKAEESK